MHFAQFEFSRQKYVCVFLLICISIFTLKMIFIENWTFNIWHENSKFCKQKEFIFGTKIQKLNLVTKDFSSTNLLLCVLFMQNFLYFLHERSDFLTHIFSRCHRISIKNCLHHCSRNLSSCYLWSLESMSFNCAIHCGKICKMLSLNTSCNFWRMDFCEQSTQCGKLSKIKLNCEFCLYVCTYG